MCAGADSIDDLDMLRAGGMPTLFDGVYAPSTLGTLLREFSFGHARQLESVLREHLITLAERTEVLAGLGQQAFIDIDSLLRPVYGHAKQGASYGHTKIAGKQVLARASHRWPPRSAPSTARRLSPGSGSARERPARARAPGEVAQAITTARAAGATGKILGARRLAYGNSLRVLIRLRFRCAT
jgi:hypothetical protein